MYSVSRHLKNQRLFFLTGKTMDYKWRIQQLDLLENMLMSSSEDILNSLYLDMHKPPAEAYASEIAPVLSDIRYAKKNLRFWMNPQRLDIPFLNLFTKGIQYLQPFGIILIIGPWNYPFGLLLKPLVFAISAGNCVILKPSEFAPASSRILSDLINKTFNNLSIACFEGNINSTLQVIKNEEVDRVFFCGGEITGRNTMQSCTRNLIDHKHENNCLNPCIIDIDVPVKTTARRIASGKFFNAGQTNFAPNICFIHKKIKNEFTHTLTEVLNQFYGPTPRHSTAFARIINNNHFHRIKTLLRSSNGKVIEGGILDEENLYISPTLIEIENNNDPLFYENIFGPVLPLVYYDSIDEVIRTLRQRSPLHSISLFTVDNACKELVRGGMVSENYCVNGIPHFMANNFGSFETIPKKDMITYRSNTSIDTFSFKRSEIQKPFFPDLKIFYPPYNVPLWLMKKTVNTIIL
ncbi:MAG TPA: aldehyde dehydrogenase family protein [Chitinispirillaceae bacterium]|nr:aldehyde dehydrogenase family protein [Chitinispirillaceae bacterium]